jgi:hypothetical protein
MAEWLWWLTHLAALLGAMQWCGEQGACRTFRTVVDGDGSARLSFELMGASSHEWGKLVRWPGKDEDDSEVTLWIGE